MGKECHLNVREAINRTKEFMQLWLKFHQVYKDAMSKPAITPEEEESFLQTKSIMASKFQTLAESLSIERMTVDRTFEVINSILSLKSISALAEHTLKKLENDWHESYISLNRLLGHLEAQREVQTKDAEPAVGKTWNFIAKCFLYLCAVILFVSISFFILYMLGLIRGPILGK